MNKEIKKEWIAALKSGEYEQGTGLLHYEQDDEIKYCCLGVLCDLAVKKGIIKPPGTVKYNFSDQTAYYYGTGEHKIVSVLPTEVANWAEITQDGHFYENHGEVIKSLATINDDGANFEEIAKIIEEKF